MFESRSFEKSLGEMLLQYLVQLLILFPLCIGVAFILDPLKKLEPKSVMENIAPAAALIVGLLSYVITRFWHQRAAQWVFVLPVTMFIYVTLTTAAYWKPDTHMSRWQFVFVNQMGLKPACEGDCFGAIFVLAALHGSLYSIGGYLANLLPRSRIY